MQFFCASSLLKVRLLYKQLNKAPKKHKSELSDSKNSQQISILRSIAEIFQFEMDVGFKLNVNNLKNFWKKIKML